MTPTISKRAGLAATGRCCRSCPKPSSSAASSRIARGARLGVLLLRAEAIANAVKPPDGHWIYNIWKIWDEEVAVEPDPAKQTAAFKKILDIWATELPIIGFLGELPAPTIVKNGFKGYPRRYAE